MYLVRPTKTEKVLTSPRSKEEQEEREGGREGEREPGNGVGRLIIYSRVTSLTCSRLMATSSMTHFPSP